jgi:hypothetical protein
MPKRTIRGLLVAVAVGVLYGVADVSVVGGLTAFTCCLIGAALAYPQDPRT